jgi:predicted TIM-barrel fold metal-dependent hydrolase
VDLVGQDRVVVGTDLPFDMADPHFARYLADAKLTPEALEAVSAANAASLFNLPAPPSTRAA